MPSWILTVRASRLAVAVLLLPAALPAEGWRVTATATSDYVLRGVSQTDGRGALQSGAEWSHRSGLFAGLWTSRIDLPASGPGREPRRRELDLYAGYGRRLAGSWSLDLVAVRYLYPESRPGSHYDYWEGEATVRYRDAVALGVTFSPEPMGVGSDSLSWELSLRWPLAGGLHLTGGRGEYRLGTSYLDAWEFWSAGLEASRGPVTIDLSWFGTDGRARRAFGEAADDRVVLSVSVAIAGGGDRAGGFEPFLSAIEPMLRQAVPTAATTRTRR